MKLLFDCIPLKDICKKL